MADNNNRPPEGEEHGREQNLAQTVDQFLKNSISRGWDWVFPQNPQLQDDRMHVTIAVQRDPNALRFATPRLQDDPEIVRIAMQLDPETLECASPRLQDDPEIVRIAIQCYHLPSPFRHASLRLRTDHEFIREAVNFCPYAFQAVPRYVWSEDEDFLLQILLLHKNSLLQDSVVTKKIALKVVQNAEGNLGYLSQTFRADREVVTHAIQSHVLALAYACETLKDNPDIVLQAMEQNPAAIIFASDRLQADPEFVVEAVKHVNFVFQERWWRANRRIVLEAAKRHPNTLHQVSDALRNDHEVVLEAVRLNGLQLRNASEECRQNRDIVVEAVRQTSDAIVFAQGPARVDPHVIAAMIRSSAEFYLPPNTEQQLSVVIAAISKLHYQELHDRESGRVVSFEDARGQDGGTAARNFAEQVWKRSLYQEIWLIREKFGAPHDLIIYFMRDFKAEFLLANELVRLSPIFAAYADRGINWNGILYAGTTSLSFD